MNKFRAACRCLAFCLAPKMTDTSGYFLAGLIVVVGLSAMYGWADNPWED